MTVQKLLTKRSNTPGQAGVVASDVLPSCALETIWVMQDTSTSSLLSSMTKRLTSNAPCPHASTLSATCSIVWYSPRKDHCSSRARHCRQGSVEPSTSIKVFCMHTFTLLSYSLQEKIIKDLKIRLEASSGGTNDELCAARGRHFYGELHCHCCFVIYIWQVPVQGLAFSIRRCSVSGHVHTDSRHSPGLASAS
jgi:hypothetical protein